MSPLQVRILIKPFSIYCVDYDILLSHKNEWNNAICRNVDGPRDCHTKWSKSDREDKYHMMSLIYDILKNNSHECIYKTEIGPKK